MSESNLYGLHGSFEKYWWYLLGEAFIIVGIVIVQVRIMRGLLQADSIVWSYIWVCAIINMFKYPIIIS